jgi:hypothetical protein
MTAAHRDPTTYSLLTYGWVLLLSGWGGVVSFWRKRREGHVRPFNFTELIGEIFTAGFVGMLTFWLCEAAGSNPLITAALVGISGHMGSRAIFGLEQWAVRKFPMYDPTAGKDR